MNRNTEHDFCQNQKQDNKTNEQLPFNQDKAEVDMMLELNRLKFEFRIMKEQYNDVKRERDQLKRRLQYIENSRTWRYLSPVRYLVRQIKRINSLKASDFKANEGRIFDIDLQELESYPILTEKVGSSSLFQVRALSFPKFSDQRTGRKKVELLLCPNGKVVKEYLNDLRKGDFFQDNGLAEWEEFSPTRDLITQVLPIINFSVYVNNFRTVDNVKRLFEIKLASPNENIQDDGLGQIILSKPLTELLKGLARDSFAQYKLLHLLLSFILLEKDLKAAIINLRLSFSFPGFCLKTRLLTSYYSEGLKDILEKVEANDASSINSDDLYDLIGALMNLSGYRRIALKMLYPRKKHEKRIDLRTATYGLTVNRWNLLKFMSSTDGKNKLRTLTKRRYGHAEILFLTLRARPQNFSKTFRDNIGSSTRPLLEGLSVEANILAQKIVEKVYTFMKEGRYPTPEERTSKALTNNKVKKVFVSGFGWSGSSALSDLIKDCEGIAPMPGPGKHKLINLGAEDETTIFENVGSLAGLWDRFILGEKKPNALLDFVRIHVLGVFPRRALEMKACLWTREFSKAYDVLYFRLIDEFLYNLLGDPRKGIADKKNSFKQFSNQLINLVAEDKGVNIILFDNVIKAQSIHRLEMIGDATCIVVARDPDDQFISMQRENMYVSRSPEVFVNMQYDKIRSFIDSAKLLEKDRSIKTYAIFFEDLIQRGSKWRECLLRDLLGPDAILPKEDTPDKRFDPAVSSKNIGLYKESGRRFASEHGLSKEAYKKILAPFLWLGN